MTDTSWAVPGALGAIFTYSVGPSAGHARVVEIRRRTATQIVVAAADEQRFRVSDGSPVGGGRGTLLPLDSFLVVNARAQEMTGSMRYAIEKKLSERTDNIARARRVIREARALLDAALADLDFVEGACGTLDPEVTR